MREDEPRSSCPLNLFLEMFGDRWSLLIVRDLLFGDKHEFGDFLSAREGIATNMLADRLRRLERHGVVNKHAHPTDARKVVYRLSMKGADLAPALVEMALWAAKYERIEIPETLLRRMTHERDEMIRELKTRVAAG
ncbi:MAG: helix-turn-helix domain-containing protein [Methylocystis sp.]